MSVEIFSKRLNELLLEEGLTGYDLKVETGIPMQSIVHWSRGVYYPNPKYLLVLIDRFNVSADYLLGLEDYVAEKLPKRSLSFADTQKSIVEKLENYRSREKITYYKLAKRLGVGQSTLKRWMQGSMPEKAILIRIARLLGVSVDVLLNRQEIDKG